jgi:hypothetical protein
MYASGGEGKSRQDFRDCCCRRERGLRESSTLCRAHNSARIRPPADLARMLEFIKYIAHNRVPGCRMQKFFKLVPIIQEPAKQAKKNFEGQWKVTL